MNEQSSNSCKGQHEPLDFLLNDPHPEFGADSRRWQTLFRLTPKMVEWPQAEELSKCMWTIRAAGAALKLDFNGLKIVPLEAPLGDWGAGDFDYIKSTVLAPHAAVLKRLLHAVAERTE